MLSVVAKDASDPAKMQNDLASFEDFWLLYPKRVAKRDAEKSWMRLTEADRVAALVGVVKWRPLWLARGEPQFIPHASTWLHGARWEDELPIDAVQRPAAHSPAVLPADVPRGVIPEDVKALIAKMRAKK